MNRYVVPGAVGERVSNKLYTHALTGKWPYDNDNPRVVHRWSQSAVAARKAMNSFLARGAYDLEVREVVKIKVK